MTILVGPLCGTVEELLDEMERRGVAPGTVRAWRGPDGLWRGIGDALEDSEDQEQGGTR